MSEDMIYQLRTAYYIGKHSAMLELWNSFQDSGASFPDREDIEFLIQRAAIMCQGNCAIQGVECSAKVTTKPIFLDYLAALEASSDVEIHKQLFSKFSEIFAQNQSSLHHRMIHNYLANAIGEYALMVDIDKKHKICYFDKYDIP